MPSISSREAPPPVEMWLKPPSSRPRVRTDAAESPPPTTVKEPFSFVAAIMASATALVPSAKFGNSNTPIGPFQNTVLESLMASA